MAIEGEYFSALDAASGKLFLVATRAVDILFARDKRLGADWRFAHEAAETFLVPLSALVFHLLGSCTRERKSLLKPSSNTLFS